MISKGSFSADHLCNLERNYTAMQKEMPVRSLSQLSIIEIEALQHLAIQRLKGLNLGVGHIHIPKNNTTNTKYYSGLKKLSLKSRKALNSNAFFGDRARDTSSVGPGSVFSKHLKKLPSTPILSSLLDEPEKLEQFLLRTDVKPATTSSCENSHETIMSISMSDTYSLTSTPFIRNAPLRRSCPNRTKDFNFTVDSGIASDSSQARFESSISVCDLDVTGDDSGGKATPLLEETLRADKDSCTSGSVAYIPCFLLEAVRHVVVCGLCLEGIFRKNGSYVRMKHLREQWELGELPEALPGYMNMDKPPTGHYRFSIELHRPHDIASLMKEFLRELPSPVMTSELRSVLLSFVGPQIQSRRNCLRWLIWLLPEINRDILRLILALCHLVLKYKSQNKMDATALAIILAPTLMQTPFSANQSFDKHTTQPDVVIVKAMIDYYNEIFIVPSTDSYLILTILKLQYPEYFPSTVKQPQQQQKHANKFADSMKVESFEFETDSRNFSPLTASCYVGTTYSRTPPVMKHSTLDQRNCNSGDPDARKSSNKSNSELGKKVKNFFKRALHNPFDSPTSPKKLFRPGRGSQNDITKETKTLRSDDGSISYIDEGSVTKIRARTIPNYENVRNQCQASPHREQRWSVNSGNKVLPENKSGLRNETLPIPSENSMRETSSQAKRFEINYNHFKNKPNLNHNNFLSPPSKKCNSYYPTFTNSYAARTNDIMTLLPEYSTNNCKMLPNIKTSELHSNFSQPLSRQKPIECNSSLKSETHKLSREALMNSVQFASSSSHYSSSNISNSVAKRVAALGGVENEIRRDANKLLSKRKMNGLMENDSNNARKNVRNTSNHNCGVTSLSSTQPIYSRPSTYKVATQLFD